MQVTFFGAASEIGRSCIMLESPEARILLDAGVKIGEEEEYPLIDDSDLKDIDAIIISHAHLDHSAYLPHIYTEGYMGDVYATKPTVELVNILTSDYLKISEPGNVTKEGYNRMQKHYKMVDYHKPFQIKDMEIRLIPAGHILGSAMIEVKAGKSKAIYTGDVNLRTTKLLDPAYTECLNANILITESTYGGDKDVFQPEKQILTSMTSSIKETISRGGKAIIPSFGVGRAQEVLLILDDYMRSGALPTVPIYTDGMVNKAMRIHRHNVIYCRDELQKRILLNDDDPFKSRNFVPVEGIPARKKIMGSTESSIIVTTSGMLTGGPVLRYLSGMAADEKNKLILVGYQAEGTRGRELADGAGKIEIDGRNVDIKLAVEQYRLSAHADRQQLMNLIGKIQGLEDLFIVHGEPSRQRELGNAVGNICKTHIPALKDSYNV